MEEVKIKDFLPKAFHLTLFRGNRQNKAEMKPNWIIKRKAEFSLAEKKKLANERKVVGSVVEWLKRRARDQQSLGSKPTRAILLCP